MAGTINYLYDPNQPVWVITTCDSDIITVREGIVYSVKGTVVSPPLTNTVKYYITLTGENSTLSYDETDVFGDLTSALAEYEIRLQN